MKRFAILAALALAACGSHDAGGPPPQPPPVASGAAISSATSAPAADEAPPALRLPGDVHPTHQRISAHIVPDEDRFSGAVDVDVRLDRSRAVVWMHGKGLHVSRASVKPASGAPIDARWEERDDTGMASLTLASPAPAGEATIHVEYDGAFATGLKGLFRAKQAGIAYAFTQFEAMAARQAFPCFDEPSFKIPFDVTLEVPENGQAIANTREVSRAPGASPGLQKVTFATTKPLPTYLVAFAVGPLDVVAAKDVPPNAIRKRPLPLRAIAAKGRGKDLGYAVAHTGEIVSKLEEYFGVEYPYDKLDVLAVPDKTGAMENAGAITFREGYLLFDEKTASVTQKRGFAQVMTHEVAHQWTGDLVTMKWWDDVWLNEAFATWAQKIADAWDPSSHAALDLVEGAQRVMGTDALVSARAIRQPITSKHDVENAFDGLTYEKGAAVLAMFERWMGPDTFRKGLHEYLVAHAFANADVDDLLSALSRAAGKDVAAPMRTFLDRPGVPFVEAESKCDGSKTGSVHLSQSRFLPLGSSGAADLGPWQIPVCVRYALASGGAPKEACTLLTEREADLPLEGCAAWVMPNADAAGYYRFALAPKDLASLRGKGLASLDVREKMAFANGLRAAWARGVLGFSDVLPAMAPLAADPAAEVSTEPMGLLAEAHDWLAGDPLGAKVEASARDLYAPAMRRLGWGKLADEEQAFERRALVDFLARTARDPAVRAEAKRRALAYVGHGKGNVVDGTAIASDLAAPALAVLGEDADAATWAELDALLDKTQDDALRTRILYALGGAHDDALATRARALALDPRLRVTEVLTPLSAQLASSQMRDATWAWMKSNFDALLARVPAHHGGVRLLSMLARFCDDDRASDIEAFLKDRAPAIEGGPHVLATTLESIRLCAARRKAQEPTIRAYYAGK